MRNIMKKATLFICSTVTLLTNSLHFLQTATPGYHTDTTITEAADSARPLSSPDSVSKIVLPLLDPYEEISASGTMITHHRDLPESEYFAPSTKQAQQSDPTDAATAPTPTLAEKPDPEFLSNQVKVHLMNLRVIQSTYDNFADLKSTYRTDSLVGRTLALNEYKKKYTMLKKHLEKDIRKLKKKLDLPAAEDTASYNKEKVRKRIHSAEQQQKASAATLENMEKALNADLSPADKPLPKKVSSEALEAITQAKTDRKNTIAIIRLANQKPIHLAGLHGNIEDEDLDSFDPKFVTKANNAIRSAHQIIARLPKSNHKRAILVESVARLTARKEHFPLEKATVMLHEFREYLQDKIWTRQHDENFTAEMWKFKELVMQLPADQQSVFNKEIKVLIEQRASRIAKPEMVIKKLAVPIELSDSIAEN